MKTAIEMAREAEFPAANYPALVSDGEWGALERFAELVRADEREACAKVCESHGPTLANGAMLAEAIRNRSNT